MRVAEPPLDLGEPLIDPDRQAVQDEAMSEHPAQRAGDSAALAGPLDRPSRSDRPDPSYAAGGTHLSVASERRVENRLW